MDCGSPQLDGSFCTRKPTKKSLYCSIHAFVYCEICDDQYRLIQKKHHFNCKTHLLNLKLKT